jgi:hypothetical protein
MPTHLDEAIKIILSADSKLRDKTPRLYALPDKLPEGWGELKRMRYLDHDVSAGRNIKRWLKRDYEASRLVIQEPPFDEVKDQSEIFTMIREPYQRWWSGIRDFMYLLPWYPWWKNEQIMEQWPHFHRATFRIHDVMEQIKPQHMIKVDDGLNDRIIAFAKKHRLLCFGDIPHERHIRHSRTDIQKLEQVGQEELQKWLKENPEWQKKLDDYLEPDLQYWEQVKGQD